MSLFKELGKELEKKNIKRLKSVLKGENGQNCIDK